jgi:glycosyltransferase involved in cell wall biosynthesis
VSEQVRQVMSARLRYPTDRIDVVPRGRDPAVLGCRTAARRSDTRRALGIGDHEQVVLSVARHEPAKALDQVVEAMSLVARRHPRARLLVAGREGTDTPVVEQAIWRCGMGERVQLLGARDDVGDLLCAADVFVLASRREGMPGSVIEALALEAPVVASDLPQVREVTGTDAARLTPVDDPHTVAGAVGDLLDDPATAVAQARRGRARFDRSFTIGATAPAMVEFYERALRAARRRHRPD